MNKNALRTTVVASGLLLAGHAWATNGMLMEGYGPVGLSMGGAAQAYDNGTAAMMNNPATLQLGENGTRADLAIGLLGPNVTAMGEKSGGTAYWMPAFGWIRKNDQLSYGIGVMGQGGMGTEYGANSQMAMGTGEPVRSELAVGRVIFPVSYKVNTQLNVGGSLDYSWSSLDLLMAATAGQLGQMFTAGSGAFAPANLPQSGMARIDFSNNNGFTGAAKSSGFTGKLGLTYAFDNALTLGASYQFKTALADMKTAASGASLTMGGQVIPGQMVIQNFQMPSILAAGLAFQANPKLMLVADVKRINWASVMESFKMTFSNAYGSVSFAMPQNWKDQTVLSLGGAYKLDDAWTVRAGYSHSTNPVPDSTVNPLFPAIVKDHFTAGFGYRISKSTSLETAVSHAPKVTVAAGQLGGQSITHSQTNYQLMLSYRY